MRISIDDFTEVPYSPMQEVHLEEIEMMNAVYKLLEAVESDSGDRLLLTEKLDELLLHTREHFANEERLMREYNFPPYQMHKGSHDLFLADMEQMLMDWKSNHKIAPVGQFLRSELPSWMKQHIATMDFVTAGFLAG